MITHLYCYLTRITNKWQYMYRQRCAKNEELANMIADMNLTLALSCMIAIMWLFCGRCKAAPGLNTGVHRNLRNHPHIHG